MTETKKCGHKDCEWSPTPKGENGEYRIVATQIIEHLQEEHNGYFSFEVEKYGRDPN